MKRKSIDYPIGSVSCGTMRESDLIPEFVYTLRQLAKTRKDIDWQTRRTHLATCRAIDKASRKRGYYESEDAAYDLNEDLFNALNVYAAPYFYFGAHPGDGADYGYWLSEEWDEEFAESPKGMREDDMPIGVKVSDLADVPKWFRGEVALVSDHGNITLYVKTRYGLREIWAIV